MTLKPLLLALAIAPACATAQDNSYCSEPGEMVSEDASGDATINGAVPDPVEAHDVQAVFFAEPATEPGKLLITMKVASLEPEPAPNSLYRVGFFLSDGTEYFVSFRPYVLPAGENQAPYNYGHVEPPSNPATSGTVVNDGPIEGRFTSDGLITWILPRDTIPALVNETFVDNIVGESNVIAGSPFSRPVNVPPTPVPLISALLLTVDEAPAGFYEFRGNASCGGKSAGLLGAGAWSPAALILLGLTALWRRRGGAPLLFGTVALAGLSACQNSTDLSVAEKLRQLSSEPVPNALALAQALPGFGGYLFDADGMPAVYLTDAAQRPAAAAALAGFLAANDFAESDLRVLAGRYDYLQLDAWHRAAYPEVLAIPGAVFSDLDEGANVLRFGMENEAAMALAQAAVSRLQIPDDAVVIQKTAPIQPLQAQRRTTTQDGRARPVIGGYQINFAIETPIAGNAPSFVCTLGFNAFKDGERSFITNSHCSNIDANRDVAITRYFQPTIDPENYIALETDDPSPQTIASNPDCPAGFQCRYSDSSRAAYADETPSELGRLARTTERGEAEGSLVIDTVRPPFRIVAKQRDSVIGERANKVGRTTGWTHGRVTATCVNSVGTGSTNLYMRLCSTQASFGVQAGDSGSPVFAHVNASTQSEEVKLLGIVWGSGGTYSPLSGVERELGELQVHE